MLHYSRNASHSTPLLLLSSSFSSSPTTTTSDGEEEETPAAPPPPTRRNYDFQDHNFKIPKAPISNSHSYKSLAILPGHVGSVSCISICGEFILSASQGRDIIVWQLPDLRQFTKFGQGDGSVKALLTVGNRVFTAHQDTRIRAWKVSRSSENIFRLIDTLPTTKDYLGKFMKQSNYVQTRRNHKKLWIEHDDSISCLAFQNGYIYSGSWDKTIKVWNLKDFKCMESIKAHDDAINALIGSRGIIYSASADGKIKAWAKQEKEQGKEEENCSENVHYLMGILEGHKDVSLNSVVVTETGNVVYGGGSDGFVVGWKRGGVNEEFWESVCEVKAHEMAVLCMCIKGEFLCSGSADKSIRIWKMEMNGGVFRVGVIKGHDGPIRCLQASPVTVGGGFMLYSGGLDRSIRVWWIPKYCESSSQDTSSVTHSNLKLLC